LASIGSFFSEIFAVIGKKEVQERRESIYTMGFLLFFWGAIFFLIIILWKGSFDFSLASLPTFIPRVLLEIILLPIALRAIVVAERSTFSFIRIATLPLLLGVDLFMGYSVSKFQMIGIGIIVLTLVILFINHGINKKGIKLVVWSTILPVATISLFKYNITYYNSVEAEGFLVTTILLLYFFFMAVKFADENPVRFLAKPLFLKQSLSEGVGMVMINFAYMFAPASVITSAKRSSSVFWAILSGNKIFHEKHIVLKLTMFVLLVTGIVLLVL